MDVLIFQAFNLLMLYIQACSDETKTNYSLLECGLQQMSCNLFPEIGTNKQMVVIIHGVHCLMMHKSRALMGKGKVAEKAGMNGFMRRLGKGQRSNDTIDSSGELLHTYNSSQCQQNMYLWYALNL